MPIADYRIHVIHDADDFLMANTYGEAVTQYRKAMTSDRLLAWSYPDEDQYLRAFARYRLMLTYVRAGNLTAAQQAHDDLMGQFFAPPPPACDPAADPNCAPPCDPSVDPACVPQPTATPLFGPVPGIEFARIADLFWGVIRSTATSANPARWSSLYGQPVILTR
jgi:hypothetical protein